MEHPIWQDGKPENLAAAAADALAWLEFWGKYLDKNLDQKKRLEPDRDWTEERQRLGLAAEELKRFIPEGEALTTTGGGE